MSEQQHPRGNGSDLVPSHGMQLTAAMAEKVLIEGDLSKLSPAERVRHYFAVCESLGLDWRTRPFDYLKDRAGKMQLYARKDCTEQLRKRDGIRLSVSAPSIQNDLIIVKATATRPDGRVDEDIGVVPMAGLKGEALSNAMLKAVTKAKRRVTLSICGLGIPDESEIDSIPDSVRIPADLPVATDEPIGPLTTPKVGAFDDLPPDWRDYMDKLKIKLDMARDEAEVTRFGKLNSVTHGLAKGPPGVPKMIEELLADAYERVRVKAPDMDDDGSDAAEPGSLDEVLPPELRAKPETPAE